MTAEYTMYDDGERSGIKVSVLSYDGLVEIEQFGEDGVSTSRISIATSTVYNQNIIDQLIKALQESKKLVDEHFC
jgi:hypothetical protein